MADSAKSPGVHIEEDASLRIPVTAGATAVPVFVADFGAAFEGLVRVNSWLELPEAAGADTASGVTGGVLREYFENGGGRCYLANTTGRALQKTVDLGRGLTDRGGERGQRPVDQPAHVL
ncbi:hypothetical protein ACFWJ4_13955 [Kitasatospora sp. NPDC127067]|uniref:hypothetical protein n=1 Tax=Kitasatospora sp. NPDC127067 TaxID=3347126 RepID=UPI0036528FF0